MKVEINEKGKSKERDFPKLMISHLGQIILAYDEKDNCLCGILLESNGYGIGKSYTEKWSITAFQDFDGSITLSND